MREDISKTYGRVWGASGVQGFFGEGYRFHRYLGPFGPTFDGMTFVAKTTTLRPREGNTPLAKDHTPRDLMPASVHVGLRGFWGGYALNSWGLSGPGIAALLASGKWQDRTEPFMISFMTVEEDPEDQRKDLEWMIELLRRRHFNCSTEFAVQLNISCPNTHADTQEVVKGAERMLDVLTKFDRPVIVKVSVDMPISVVASIADHPACAGICVSNTVKFGNLSDRINWKQLYGDVSPLARLGGGGLSGAPLLPLVIEYVQRLRLLGVGKHLNAGGGVMHKRDVDKLIKAGADSISLGTIAMLRPWCVQGTINYANNAFKARE